MGSNIEDLEKSMERSYLQMMRSKHVLVVAIVIAVKQRDVLFVPQQALTRIGFRT